MGELASAIGTVVILGGAASVLAVTVLPLLLVLYLRELGALGRVVRPDGGRIDGVLAWALLVPGVPVVLWPIVLRDVRLSLARVAHGLRTDGLDAIGASAWIAYVATVVLLLIGTYEAFVAGMLAFLLLLLLLAILRARLRAVRRAVEAGAVGQDGR